MNSPVEILLIEDDPSMGYLLRDSLEMAGYQVVLCTDGNTALATYHRKKFQLLIIKKIFAEGRHSASFFSTILG